MSYEMPEFDVVSIAQMLSINKITERVMSIYSECHKRDYVVSPEQFYSIMFNLPDTHKFLLAIRKDTAEIVGLCTVNLETTLFHGGATRCVITDIMVPERYRRMGVGTRLLNGVRALAQVRGCRAMRATVSRKLTAEEEVATSAFFLGHRFRPIIGHYLFEMPIGHRVGGG